jgi:mevalonate kinase
MKINYKAPATIFLSGEYSVLYGEGALLTSFNLFNSFTIIKAKKTPPKPEKMVLEVQKLIEEYLQENSINHEVRPYEYKLSIEIPEDKDLGSKASLIVCVCAGIYEYFTTEFADKQTLLALSKYVFKKVYPGESLAQLSACILGGLVFYREDFDFLDFQSNLPFQMPELFTDNFYLIHTGDRTETVSDLKQDVKDRLEENPARLKKVFRDIGKTTKAMVLGLKDEREKLIMDTIFKNAKLLTHLDVVSSSTTNLLISLEGFGAGKPTGYAGFENGSEFLIFYSYPKAKQDLEEFLEKRRLPYIKISLDNKGVERFEK